MNARQEIVYSVDGPARDPWVAGEVVAYHRLALQLHHDLPGEHGRRCVLVASANRSPDTSRVAVQLAHSLGEQLQRPVMLVDAHPADRDLSRLLGCAAAQGFTDLLADAQLRPQDLALPTSNPWVSVLGAGVTAASLRVRSPDATARVVQALRGAADLVVLHGGSVLDDTAALALAPNTDGVLLVAFENQTLLTNLDLAQRALRGCKARHVGLVIGSAAGGR